MILLHACRTLPARLPSGLDLMMAPGPPPPSPERFIAAPGSRHSRSLPDTPPETMPCPPVRLLTAADPSCPSCGYSHRAPAMTRA